MFASRSPDNPGLAHHAIFYRSDDDYARGVGAFVADAVSAGEPVFVAVPPDRLAVLQVVLDGLANRVAIADMSELGRNPGRIIPAVRRFLAAHPGRRTRFVGEPIWPGRSPTERREATRHEALINTAFADADTTILCPYVEARLDPVVLADARRTHPTLWQHGEAVASPAYTEPSELLDQLHGLDPAPLETPVLVFDGANLHGLRRHLADRARDLGLSGRRLTDLLVAANEIATNALAHARSPATLRTWAAGGEVVCEVSSGGHITDPLAGRHLPLLGAAGGRGLFLANQVCDLVELRSDESGTVVRLHLRRG